MSAEYEKLRLAVALLRDALFGDRRKGVDDECPLCGGSRLDPAMPTGHEEGCEMGALFALVDDVATAEVPRAGEVTREDYAALLGSRVHERLSQMRFAPRNEAEWQGLVATVLDGMFTEPLPAPPRLPVVAPTEPHVEAMSEAERRCREAMGREYPWEDCDWGWFADIVPELLNELEKLRALQVRTQGWLDEFQGVAASASLRAHTAESKLALRSEPVAAEPTASRAEAFVYGVLDPDTLALESVGIFSNWHGFRGALPQHVMTRDLRKPMVVIDHAFGADIRECEEHLRERWEQTVCAEGPIHERFPASSLFRSWPAGAR